MAHYVSIEMTDERIRTFAGLMILECAADDEAWETFWASVQKARQTYYRDGQHIQRWTQELGDGPPEESG